MDTHSPWPRAIAAVVGILMGIAVDRSANGESPKEPPLVEGLISDQTMTPVGHRIFISFARIWIEKNPAKRANITVRERPSARWGTLMTVEHGSRVLFKAVVSPARLNADAFAENAATAAANQLINDMLDGSPDLARRDELE